MSGCVSKNAGKRVRVRICTLMTIQNDTAIGRCMRLRLFHAVLRCCVLQCVPRGEMEKGGG